VFVEFQIGEDRELTGMDGKHCDYFRELLIHGRGLGILFHSFKGELQKKSELDPELAAFCQSGKVNFVRFLLNDGQCDRVAEYWKQFRDQNMGRHYGLFNRPRYGEGSGCSAFGASFAEVAGVLDQEVIDAWSHSVNIPLKYAGPPLREERVNLLNLMWNARRWAAENEDHRKLYFWDPDRMFQWIRQMCDSKDDFCKVGQIGKAQGLILEKTHLAVPRGPIWLDERTAADESVVPVSGEPGITALATT
jgi:hypothetical protein